MTVYESDIEVNGVLHHIVVNEPLGAGEGYHLMIDNYFCGQIVHRPEGLHPYVRTGHVLSGDDLSVIIDLLAGRV